MRLSMISFTENGKRLSGHIAKLLRSEMETRLYTKCEAGTNDDMDADISFVTASVGEWAKKQMQESCGLLFIGACGIAVRAIAPHLSDKLRDAPVLVMDEKGKYVIPVLSGHMGGANDLAVYLAEKTGAEPVITTATDINQKFAVDLFAKRNHLSIANKDGIAKVSAKVLAGKEVTISIETGHETICEAAGLQFTPKFCTALQNYGPITLNSQESGTSPQADSQCPRGRPCAGFVTVSTAGVSSNAAGVRSVPYPPAGFVDIVVTSKEDVFDTSILLKPREYVIGLGCKRGKNVNEIDAFISKTIHEMGISITQIFALSSVSQKRDEQGIVAWCRKEGILFFTYTAEELQEVNGNFTESAFVKAQVGVANVCERAAVKACGENGTLILSKTVENGMTIAVAKREWKVCLDGK